MTRQNDGGTIYGEVKTLGDIREINRKIRGEMRRAERRDELTELKKRSDYLCTLTYAPSWQSRFGRKSGKFRQVAQEEDRRSTKIANSVARRKGFDVEYQAWRAS